MRIPDIMDMVRVGQQAKPIAKGRQPTSYPRMKPQFGWFWCEWVLVTTLGIAVPMLLSQLIFGTYELFIGAMLIPPILGWLQWRMLQRRSRHFGSWGWLTLLGGLGGFVTYGLLGLGATVFALPHLGAIALLSLSLGSVCALPQFWLLRLYYHRAIGWILATQGGLWLGASAAYGFSPLLRQLPPPLADPLSLSLLGILIGGSYAGVTGAMLLVLVRHPKTRW